MEDLVREVKLMNQNLINLQTQAEEDRNEIRNINRRMRNIEDRLDNNSSNDQREFESSQRFSSNVESGETIPLRNMQEEQTGTPKFFGIHL